MADWGNFFLGELGAAAALAGLLFVALSVNQERILAIGRMADRGLETLVMLFLVLIVASLPLIPGQPLRLLGSEVLVLAAGTLLTLVPVQLAHMRVVRAEYRRPLQRMIRLNRIAMSLIGLGGAVLIWRNDLDGLYVLPVGILLTFITVGINAWVLLIEINR